MWLMEIGNECMTYSEMIAGADQQLILYQVFQSVWLTRKLRNGKLSGRNGMHSEIIGLPLFYRHQVKIAGWIVRCFYTQPVQAFECTQRSGAHGHIVCIYVMEQDSL